MSKTLRVFRVRVSSESALQRAGFYFKRAEVFPRDVGDLLDGCGDPSCCYVVSHDGRSRSGEEMVALQVPLSGNRFHRLLKAVGVKPEGYYR